MPLVQNRFRIISLLGSGGFGRTYLAEDTHTLAAHKCVIKQLKPITNNSQIYQLVQQRFEREAAVLEQLSKNSDRIPTLYAYFAEADLFYLVQEWIDGDTLTNKIQQQGILQQTVAKNILVNLLEILDYVHSKRIIHRDIKPDNIIVRHQDGLPVLIDFGAVKETLSTVVNSQGNPTSSIVIGTPGFMPSEQASGRPVYSSDLYSLALTIIYALTGKLPQELESNPHTGEIVWQEHAKNIDPNLIAVLDKAISWHPRERYPSAKAMLDALKVVPPPPKQQPHQPPFSYNGQPTIPVTPPTPPPPPVDSSKKTPILTVATLIVVMSGGLGLIAFAFSSNNNPSPSNTTASASPSPKYCSVVVNGNIRSEPASFRDNIIETGGDLSVTGVQTDGGWVQVKLNNGNLAWAHRDVIENHGSSMDTCLQANGIAVSKVDDIPPPASPRPEPSSQNNNTEDQSNTDSNTAYQEGFSHGQSEGRKNGQTDGEANGGTGEMNIEAGCDPSTGTGNEEYNRGFTEGCFPTYREAFLAASQAAKENNSGNQEEGNNEQENNGDNQGQ